MSSEPLAGIRILDFTRILSGPYCTLLLRELGAEVIKIERPGTGDDTRAWGPPFLSDDPDTATYFAGVNRGKRSVAVDAASPEGRHIIRRLVEKVDVVVENFRPGVAERLGLHHDALRAINPAIVSASISGFGREGVYVDYPGTEIVVEGLSGLMSVTGDRDGQPARFGIAMTDIATGLTAAARIVAHVMRARETGAGAHVEISLYGVALGALGTLIASTSVTGTVPSRWGSHHPSIVPYGGFPTSDGDIITGVVNDKQWHEFCHVIGCSELAEDETLATNAARVRARHRVEAAVGVATSRWNTEELFDRLIAAGLLAAPIRTVADMLADSNTRELGLISEVPSRGGLLTSRVSGTKGDAREGVPALGEDTEHVLEALLGLNGDDIAALRSTGAIYVPDPASPTQEARS